MSHAFNLRIGTSGEIEKSVLSNPAQITGQIGPLSIDVYKAFCRQVFPPVIAVREGFSADADLPAHTRLAYFLKIFICDEHLAAFKRNPDGQSSFLTDVGRYPVICAVAGDFRRPVQINKFCIRERLLPLFQVPHRHNFTAEHHQPQVFRNTIAKSPEGSNNTHSRDSPDQDGNFSVTQIIQQFPRQSEVCSWNKHQRRSCPAAGKNIFHRNIKIEGCLISNTIRGTNACLTDKMTYKINRCPVAYHHSLGFSG